LSIVFRIQDYVKALNAPVYEPALYLFGAFY
jgi:hypothetical protein